MMEIFVTDSALKQIEQGKDKEVVNYHMYRHVSSGVNNELVIWLGMPDGAWVRLLTILDTLGDDDAKKIAEAIIYGLGYKRKEEKE